MTQRLRPVLGFEDSYQVSDTGLVRSVDRVIQLAGSERSYFRRGRILVQQEPSKRTHHKMVSLYRHSKEHKRYVHTLVLEAFTSPRPEGLEACHNDGDATNNTVDNLRWDTRKANAADALRHGTFRHLKITHCPQKHEYTAENTVMITNRANSKARRCRTCHNARTRLQQQRRRERRRAEQHLDRKGTRDD